MNCITRGALKGTFLVASIFALGIPASATPYYGGIGFSGNNLFSFSTAGPVSYIDFQAPTNGGNGQLVSGFTSGAFNVVAPSTPGFIKDMASAAGGDPAYAVVPVGPPGVSLDNFITFSTLPGTNIRLTELQFATGCGGAVVCVDAFQLIENAGTTTVTISILGQIIDGGDTVGFVGSITAQFAGQSIAQVIAGASSATGVTSNSWSGAITSVPEPGTVTMLGAGLLAMALGGLRAKRRSSSN